MQNYIYDIYNEIHSYQYISFDLFDTLIKRSFSSVEHIFELVEIKYNTSHADHKIKNFKKKRIQAERKARKLKTREDISIEDIYNNLDYEKNICEILKKEEVKIEVGTCCENGPLVELYHMCVRGGANVIVCTDMYLDRFTICQILNKTGINEYQLFLSSEIGYTKQTGNLFDYIISDLKISSSELIHIGDNKKSDYDNAVKKGIHAIWLMEGEKQLKYWKKSHDINNDHLYTILNNKHIYPKNIEKDLGYKLLGPILYNFCIWLNEEDERKNFQKIVFVAREGYVPYLVYKTIFPEKDNKVLYLKINKNSLRMPILYKDNSINIFLQLIPYNDVYYISDIVAFLGDNEKLSDLLKKYNYSDDSVIKRSEMMLNSKFIAFYKEYINLQKSEIELQHKLLLKYFADNELEGKVALVNNSVNANAQFYLQLIQQKNSLNIKFWGMHFIISRQGIKKISNHCSIWFNEKCNQFEKRLFYRNCLIFEHLIFEPKGTALNYAVKNDRVEAICKEHEYELDNDTIIAEIKIGILEFIKDYTEKMPLHIKPSLNLNALCSLYLYPDIEDAKFICSIKDDDYEKSYLRSKWIQGRMILNKKKPDFYNIWLHIELILRKMV